IKPMVKFNKEGKLDLFKKERSIANVVKCFTDTVKECASKFKKVYVKIVDLQQNELALKLIESLKSLGNKVVITRVRTVRPTFFAHLGNNGIGICLTGVEA
ncbi:MAG: DegV family protein, partial [Bacilli bacterium]|nr:DegV family protein [Bacilli bacterium]